ncbi:MAG: hypothetical protein ACOX0U_03135 [Oscillospiraceae bacterium]|jgi:hypothetical protein
MNHEAVWRVSLLGGFGGRGQGQLGETSPVADGLNWLIDHVLEWHNGLGGLLLLGLITVLIVVGVFFFGRDKRSGGEPIKRTKYPPGAEDDPKALYCTPAEVTQLLRTVKRVNKKSCAQYSATLLDLHRKGALSLAWEGETLFLEPMESAYEALPHELCLLRWIVETKGGRKQIAFTEFIRYIKENHGLYHVYLKEFDHATLSELLDKRYVVRGKHSGFLGRLVSQIPNGLFAGVIFVFLASSTFSLYESMRGRFPWGWLVAFLLLLLSAVSVQSRKSRLYLTRTGEKAAHEWAAWADQANPAAWIAAGQTVDEIFPVAVAAEKGAAVVSFMAQGEETDKGGQDAPQARTDEAEAYSRLLNLLHLFQSVIWRAIRTSDGSKGTADQ